MNSSTSSFRNEAKAILLTLLIVGLADVGLRLAEARLSVDVRHIRSFPEITRKLSLEPSPRVVFLGNSLTRHGIDPAEWTSAMGQLALTNGSMAKLVPDDTTMPDWYYVALNNLIRPGNRPDLLVLGFASNQLTDERIEASRLGAYFCDFGNVPELFTKDLRGFTAKVDFLAGRACRLYGVRDELQARVGDKLIPGYQAGVRQLNDIRQRKLANRNQSLTRTNSYQLFDRALTLWRAQGIEVVLVAIPTPSSYQIDEAVIQKTQAVGVRLIDARQLPALSPEDFPDGYHMGPRAAQIYTRFVAEKLSDALKQNPGQIHVAVSAN